MTVAGSDPSTPLQLLSTTLRSKQETLRRNAYCTMLTDATVLQCYGTAQQLLIRQCTQSRSGNSLGLTAVAGHYALSCAHLFQ